MTVRKLFLKISRNSQENTCARVYFNKVCRPQACNFIKKETLGQAFYYFTITPFFTEHLQWLLLIKETPAEMFYCKFSKNFKKIFFIEQLRVTASLASKII